MSLDKLQKFSVNYEIENFNGIVKKESMKFFAPDDETAKLNVIHKICFNYNTFQIKRVEIIDFFNITP